MEVTLKLFVVLFVLLLVHHAICQEGTASPQWVPPAYDPLQPSRSTNLVRTDSPLLNQHKNPTEVLPPQAPGVQQSPASPDPVIPLIPHIPEMPKQNSRGSHISDFTNPKTGHNPFLDLIEGTSTSTSRIASIIEERQDNVGSPPALAEASPPRPIEESRWTRPRHPSTNSHPRQHTIKFPTSRTSEYPIEGNTHGRPRLTTEPVEGTPDVGRPHLSFDRPRSHPRYDHPPLVKEDIPVRIWTKPSNEVPWTPKPEAPPQVKSTQGESTNPVTASTQSTSLNNPTSVSRVPHFTQVHLRSTPNSKIIIRPSDKSKDGERESITPAVNSKQNIYMGGMITGAAVVFFAALMAICMWRQRAKTLSRRDTRFIADHDASCQTREVCGKSAIFSSKIP